MTDNQDARLALTEEEILKELAIRVSNLLSIFPDAEWSLIVTDSSGAFSLGTMSIGKVRQEVEDLCERKISDESFVPGTSFLPN